MLLVVNTANLISDERYVKPIVELLGDHLFTRHFMEVENLPKNIGRVIISGNSIFSTNLSVRDIKSEFNWLDTFEKPILGICAGQQIIARYFGSSVERNDGRGIRKFTVHKRDPILKGVKDKFNGYVSHNFYVPCPKEFEILASSNVVKMHSEYLAKHKTKDIYICSFHPEFSEKQILENFAKFR